MHWDGDGFGSPLKVPCNNLQVEVVFQLAT